VPGILSHGTYHTERGPRTRRRRQGEGRIKEAGGALSGDSSLKSEGRGDQAKGTMKEKKGLLRKLFR
jgi:uncharacterized protein YjbJ (UPF0337 family)